MGLLRHLAGGRRALTATVAAIGLACGLGVGAPAAHAGTGCTWAPIPLASGWQSEQGTYGTGDPSYCVEDDGMVYLSGSAAEINGSSGDIVGYLPYGAWPTNVLYLDVYTYSGTYGVLRIFPDGVIEAYGGEGGAPSYTSLAGVSFPSAYVATSPIPLENGWQSAQGKYGNTGDPTYGITNGVVHLSGSLWRPAGNPTTGLQSVFGVLADQSLWPADNCLYRNQYVYGGSINVFSAINGATPLAFFYPAGGLFADTSQYTSLAGISYPAGGPLGVPWQVLPLVGGTQDNSYCAGAAVVAMGDVVYMAGMLDLPAGFVGEFTVLPPADRPAHTLYEIADNQVPVRINPDGTVLISKPLAAWQRVVLSGLSFPLGS
jgi:hypothetical protein